MTEFRDSMWKSLNRRLTSSSRNACGVAIAVSMSDNAANIKQMSLAVL